MSSQKKDSFKKKRNQRKSRNTVNIDQTGKVVSSSSSRDVSKSGPQKTIKIKEAKKVVSAVSSIAKTRRQAEDNSAVYVTGSVATRLEGNEGVPNLISFAQAWTSRLSIDLPHIFCHEDTQIGARTLYPVDFVAYCVTLMIGGYNRAGLLRSAEPGAFQKISDDCPVPIAIADYIQRIHLVGAPEIVKLLNLNFNPGLITGEITYNAANPFTNLSYNCMQGNSNQIEIWQYGSAPAGSATADVQDLSTYSFAISGTLGISNLFGAGGWISQRMPFMVDYLNDLEIGKVRFSDIPLTTTDCSSFGGALNGTQWVNATSICFPRHGGNPYTCIVFNPNSRDSYFPGTVFNVSVPRTTWTVSGGLYGVNPATFSQPWAGQPVSPSGMDIFMQTIQYYMAITMFAPTLKPRLFGKNGYEYHGLKISDYGRIVSVPIDYPNLVQKCLAAHFGLLNAPLSGTSLVYNYGYVQGLALMYGAMIVRKVLNSQLECWASLNGSTISNVWNIQTLVPSQTYLQSVKIPVPIAAILNEIAPVSVHGIVRVPSIGAGYLVDNWASAANPNKFYLFPKWVGFAPAGTYLSNGLIANPTVANPGDPKTWTFPRIMGASPAPANVAVEYQASAYGFDYAYTIFPSNINCVQLAVNGTNEAQLVVAVAPQGPIYDSSTLTGPFSGPTWQTGAINGGKQSYLGFQYTGAAAAVKKNFKLISEKSKVDSSKLMSVAERGIVGGSSMSINNQYSIDYTDNKPTQTINIVELDGDGVPTGLSVPVGLCMDYHADSILQCMSFCNQARLSLGFLLSVSTFPVSAQSTPAGLGLYSTAPYSANMQNVTTNAMYDDLISQCGQEGSAINKWLDARASSNLTKGGQEQTFRLGTSHKNHDVSVTEGAIISYASTVDIPETLTVFTFKQLEEAKKRYALTQTKSQDFAEIEALVSESPIEDSADFSSKQFFDTAWKGIKWAAPKALKAAVEVVPLLL